MSDVPGPTVDPEFEEGDEDPAGTDDQWRRTGDELRQLGAAFRRHYGADDGAATDDLKEAARALGRGLERFFGAVGESVKDPDVQAGARRAGTSFLDALSATFTQVGDELGRAFDDSRRRSDTDGGLEEATRELDDADLLEELRADLAGDEEPTT